MPHSSGGGSGHHGGGGHSSYHSSHSSSGSRSGSGSGYRGDAPPRFSREYYPGAKRYRYFRRGRYRYFYSMDSSFRPNLLNGLMYLPIIIFIFAMIFAPSVKWLKKYDRVIRIDDRAGVLGNSSRLHEALNAFSEKTKITPAVITLYNEEWLKYYGSLEDYAYSQYLLNFEDEKHWLIVYSEPKVKQGNWEWFWEGMQGDDTNPVLTKRVTELFNQTMQTGLVDEKSSVPDVIASAFDAVTAKAGPLKVPLDMTRLLIGGVVLLGLCISAFFSMDLHLLKYRNAEYAPENFGGEESDQYRQIPAQLSAPASDAPSQSGLYAASGMHATSGAQQFGQRKTEMDTLEKPQPAKPVFCRNCGMKNKAGTVICPSCGSRLE